MVKGEQKKRATVANGALKYSSMDQLKGRSVGAGALKPNRKTTTMVLIIGEGERQFSGVWYSGLDKGEGSPLGPGALQSIKSMMCIWPFFCLLIL